MDAPQGVILGSHEPFGPDHLPLRRFFEGYSAPLFFVFFVVSLLGNLHFFQFFFRPLLCRVISGLTSGSPFICLWSFSTATGALGDIRLSCSSRQRGRCSGLTPEGPFFWRGGSKCPPCRPGRCPLHMGAVLHLHFCGYPCSSPRGRACNWFTDDNSPPLFLLVFVISRIFHNLSGGLPVRLPLGRAPWEVSRDCGLPAALPCNPGRR